MTKKYTLCWGTKYKKPVLCNEIAIRIRELIRQFCSELDVEIIKGYVRKDHVLVVVCIPETLTLRKLLGYIKGKSARAIFVENKNIQDIYPDRHFWAIGYYAKEHLE